MVMKMQIKSPGQTDYPAPCVAEALSEVGRISGTRSSLLGAKHKCGVENLGRLRRHLSMLPYHVNKTEVLDITPRTWTFNEGPEAEINLRKGGLQELST
jgi:hypothetical protein